MSAKAVRPELCETSGPRGPVAYQRWGRDKPPLVLIGGLGSRAEIWGEMPRLLSDRFTVLAPDNRGVGGSRKGDPFTLSGAADDVALVIAEAGFAASEVIGVSMGGLIACRLATSHPDKVSHLVMASCAARTTPHQKRISRFFELVLSRLQPQETAELLMAFAFGSDFVDRFPGFLDQAIRLWTLEKEDLPGAMGQIAHLKEGWDLRLEAREIRCPTLVLAGEMDALVPASATRELAAEIADARYREVPKAGHSVLAEGGSAILAEIVEFVST